MDSIFVLKKEVTKDTIILMEGRSLFPFIVLSDTFPPKTLKKMIEKQAKWTEQDLKRLKILK